ncbi:MAG: hypothetical protein JJE46_10725 [Acidimicrobiia bacterium]|nr:hypothetical protein [Acidimicrobiia bacterium]
MSDATGDGRQDLTRDGALVGVVEWATGTDVLAASIVTVRSFGLVGSDVDAALALIADAADRSGARQVALDVRDPLVRAIARANGYSGGLRSVLGWSPSSGPIAATEQFDDARTVARLEQLLPEVRITVSSGSFLARSVRRLETGRSLTRIVTATRGSEPVSAMASVGPDLMIESLAAALDTLLVLADRIPQLARSLPRIVFGTSGRDMATGRVSGAAGGSRVWLNPAHVDRAAYEELARIPQPGAPGGAPRRPPRQPHTGFLPVDSVVAHEIGHVVDERARSGRWSSSTEFRRAVGEALGVESVEMALLGARPGAEPERVRAYEDLVEQISAYATTSAVELFAEIFAAWREDSEVPVVRAFARLMESRYPTLG